MGLEFGQLYKIRNIVQYKLSPFEQKAFAGFFKNGFPNVVRRIREEIFYIMPPVIAGYMTYSWATKTHEQLQRKNPADFENDE